MMAITSYTGLAQSEKRDVGSFTSISMGIAANLYIEQGPRTSLELEGDRDDLEDILTEVRGSSLEIKYRSRNWRIGRDRVDIYITLPDIERISMGGSGKIMSEGVLSSDDLDLKLSGSGKMSLEIRADRMDVSISGSGQMALSGVADRVELSISGSGNYQATELESDQYKIRISGSGRSSIWVNEEIDASLSGSGSIDYRGDPEKVYSNISGSGKIRKR